MPDHGLPPMPTPAPGRDERGRTPRPEQDPASRTVFSVMPLDPLRAQDIPPRRLTTTPLQVTLETFPEIEHRELTCPGHDGAALEVVVLRRRGDDAVGPGFFHVHGGGMVMGTRHDGLVDVLGHVMRHGGTAISVEYRLAPEHPAPIPVEDCYAAWVWAVENAQELGFDADELILEGSSAGAGLAAGVMLLARDRRGPRPLGVILRCPMLDDRSESLSIRQFDLGGGAWSGQSNVVGWTALLGEDRGTPHVSPYDAPARATWLGDLPPIQITVGSADPFRSEDVAFAEAIWRDGGDCELFVVPGGPHGYENVTQDAAITRMTAEVRQRWVDRLLEPDDLAAAEATRELVREQFAARSHAALDQLG